MDYFPFVGHYPQVTAAGRAGFDYLTGKATDLPEAYGRERDVRYASRR
jgi:hypothetical protein